MKDILIEASNMNGFTANNNITTNDSSFAPQPTTSWNNNTTSSCSGAFLAGNSSTSPGLEYKFELGYYSGHAKADEGGGCFAKGTKILLSNGTYKNIEDLTYSDEVLSWNFYKGQFESSKIAILVDHGEEIYKVLNLQFSED